eukprot:1016397-Lingulodinium_polyedra.AAC.1
MPAKSAPPARPLFLGPRRRNRCNSNSRKTRSRTSGPLTAAFRRTPARSFDGHAPPALLCHHPPLPR